MDSTDASTTTSQRVEPATLAHALGDWTTGNGSLYQLLATAIDAAVDRGDLPRGTWLPAERALAKQLAVSRGTVVAAYQLLRDRGVVERRQGAGTRVIVGDAGPTVVREFAAGVRARRLTSRFFRRDGHVIDLGVSLLADSAELPADAFNVDLKRLTRLADGHGYHPLGLPALRRRLAELHTTAGLPTDPAQIVVTLGAQQAIALTARLLVRPGDVVAVESPTYPGAIDAYSRAGARFATIATDTGGARPPDVARVIEHTGPRLVYLIPTAHNPTGTILPEHRRSEIAHLAEESGTWLVEDESLARLTFDRPAPTPVASHSRTGDVITIGSMSKVLWGGLRLGWIRAPEPVAARLGRLKAAQDLGNCSVSQVIVLDLIDQIDGITTAHRKLLADRCTLLCDRLASLVPDWSFRRPEGGLSLWVQLPAGAGDDLAATALDFGVGVLPGSAASADETHLDHLRLSFADTPDRLETAAGRLADAWSAHHGQERPVDPSTSLAIG